MAVFGPVVDRKVGVSWGAGYAHGRETGAFPVPPLFCLPASQIAPIDGEGPPADERHGATDGGASRYARDPPLGPLGEAPFTAFHAAHAVIPQPAADANTALPLTQFC